MKCFVNNHLSAQCLESILETIAEGLILVDSSGTIKFCNEAIRIMTGKNRDEITEHNYIDIMNNICDLSSGSELFTDSIVTNRECTIIHSSGKKLPVLMNARALKDPDGNVIGAVGTFTDLSALRTTQSRLQILEQQIREKNRFGSIVGKSHAMRNLYSMIELAAASNATVLITGETGTGKELAAQSIHDLSMRKNRQMVKLNCSALPESLLESELFGHARGSFTGAIKDKAGRFEIADGSTLFLDEIGELSLLIQVKLLRFLQEKEFERVGENTARKCDVRIIAATHRDLRKLVSDGLFREDLYYRLKVFPLHIPPLRERKEDIGALVDHFISRFNSETGKQIRGLSHDAALTMMDYCWPGNIRELENAIEHAFVICNEELIDIFDLPLEIRKVELRKGTCVTGQQTGSTAEPVKNAQYPKGRPMTDDEFIDLLRNCGGNQTEAARILGVDRTTIWRKVKKLGDRYRL